MDIYLNIILIIDNNLNIILIIDNNLNINLIINNNLNINLPSFYYLKSKITKENKKS